jgi:hypothetical protein
MQNRADAQETATVPRNSPVNAETGADQLPPLHCELSPFRPMIVHECEDAQETSGTKAEGNSGMDVGFDHPFPSNVE